MGHPLELLESKTPFRISGDPKKRNPGSWKSHRALITWTADPPPPLNTSILGLRLDALCSYFEIPKLLNHLITKTILQNKGNHVGIRDYRVGLSDPTEHWSDPDLDNLIQKFDQRKGRSHTNFKRNIYF